MSNQTANKAAKYSDYYVFQFMDGTYRIAPETRHQWNGMPNLPWLIRDGVYRTRKEAEDAIRGAA